MSDGVSGSHVNRRGCLFRQWNYVNEQFSDLSVQTDTEGKIEVQGVESSLAKEKRYRAERCSLLFS